ncbi:MAG: SRPBCC family protein [Sulfuriflexus sp.]|nr:SRPBCC family protein [Sulfuriflexus sp.]
MKFLKFVSIIWALLFVNILANAGDIIEAKVEHKDKQYFVTLEAVINADTQRVYKILTDYENLTRLSDSIKESRLIYSLSDTDHRVHVTTKACVTFFCKSIRQVQNVEELPNMVIITTSLPSKSDVDYAHARWKLESEDGLTRIYFNSDLKPSFWIPPLIGPLLIERTLRNEALAVIDGLEKLAQQR